MRKWFNHEPEKWKQFVSRYKKEIWNSEALAELRADIRNHKTVTLLYSAKDEQYNQAMALMQVLK